MTPETYLTEIGRQQALRWVADQETKEWRELADALAENVAQLLCAMTDCGIRLEGGKSGPDGDEEYWYVRLPANGLVHRDDDQAFADAIRGCNAVLGEYHALTEAVEP